MQNLKLLLQKVKVWFTSWLKGKALRWVLLRALGTTAGWKAWILKYLVTELFEEVVEPMIKALFREINEALDEQEGKKKFKRIQEAMREEDPVKYDAAVDDVFKRL